MFEDVVVFQEGIDVSGNASSNFLGMSIMNQIRMIHKDSNWGPSASEEVLLASESVDKSHEFLVPDIVVPFSVSEHTRDSSNHLFLALLIMLE